VSTEVFFWQPSLVDFSHSVAFNVLHSKFENGIDQRRLASGREIGSWKFNYKIALYNIATAKQVKDQIWAFFKARKGSYDNFYLPSWQTEAKLASNYTSGSNLVIDVNPATDLEFSQTLGDQGNFLYICENMAVTHPISTGLKHEVRRITNISGATITIASALSYTYTTHAKVMKAYRVNFASDTMPRSFSGAPFIYDTPLEFVEDIGALYA